MNASEKLQQDLKILERFNEDIPAYLRSDTVFYPTGVNYPELTFGGFLMRQHRLLLLKKSLSEAEKGRLDKVIASFQAALDNQIVRFEKHCQKELDIRFRQWRETLRDLADDKNNFNFYPTTVEPRLMIAAIVEQLQLPPFELKSDVPERLMTLDKGLHARWMAGDFVLQEGLEAAYPQEEFWYLYGQVA